MKPTCKPGHPFPRYYRKKKNGKGYCTECERIAAKERRAGVYVSKASKEKPCTPEMALKIMRLLYEWD